MGGGAEKVLQFFRVKSADDVVDALVLFALAADNVSFLLETVQDSRNRRVRDVKIVFDITLNDRLVLMPRQKSQK